jgi:hypothetical protein
MRTVLEVGPGALSEYYDWMKDAAQGDVLVYWSGDLQFDRQVVVPEGDVMRAADRQRITALNVVADRILEDAEDGLLHLTQFRVGTSFYEYRATRRRQSFGGSETSVLPNEQLVPAS